MKTMKTVCRIPLGYNDFGEIALTEEGMDLLDSMISAQLPDSCYWAGDEIIGEYDAEYDFDINEIISNCREKILNNDSRSIWAE